MPQNREFLLEKLFETYYSTRKNKRNTHSCAEYEVNYESHLIALCDRLLDKTYQPKRSICFISFYPVQREIFAANFEDRIIHHLIFNAINPIFERIFIHDSYSCRKNKGTSYGIKRAKRFTRAVSDNYTKEAYVLKLDIRGYFMNINKQVLYRQIFDVLGKAKLSGHSSASMQTYPPCGGKYKHEITLDFDFLRWIIKLVVFHDPINNVLVKGRRSDWQGLPRDKSLFHAKSDTGLPIGNLTSQLFGNIYLHGMDKFIKYQLGFKYYGRYVDDFLLFSTDRQKLVKSIEKIASYLQSIGLEVHPKKIYLQSIKHGFKFLGVFILPHRVAIDKRTKSSFYHALRKDFSSNEEFVASINSYLGYMNNYDSFRLRRKLLFDPSLELKVKFTANSNLSKVKIFGA
jgi:retron-type reverse transcriptase